MGYGTVRFRSLAFTFFFSAAIAVCAADSGAPMASEDPKPEWTIAVAAFDTTSLDASERLAGDLVAGKLAASLPSIATRSYLEAERKAYAASLAAAKVDSSAKVLAAKQSTRDALLFSGLGDWKYRKELKGAEMAVRTAREAYDASLVAVPEVAAEKPVKAAKENADGVLVAAPEPGQERAVCLQRSYDALLLGRVESYYGRTAVSVRLFSPYLNADLYADETMFSVANREQALSELARRLAAAVSGKTQSVFSVAVDPKGADIQLSGSLAGKGRVGPLERDPGTVLVEAELAGYERFRESFDLIPGERVELNISLPPLQANDLVIRALDGDGHHAEASVRLDGLYFGRTPLGTELPRERLSFVQVETLDDRGAVAVVRSDASGSVSLSLIPNLPGDAMPTEDARKKFYGAFGRFSVAMPIAFFVSGLAFSYENASVRYDGSSELAKLADRAAFASTVLWTATTAFAAESVFRFIRYLKRSGERAAKLARVDDIQGKVAWGK